MGGQACVFYGAAQVSKDIDFLILAEEENFRNLQNALDELQAKRIAIPPFLPEALDRGHAVHFRCQAPLVAGLRIDYDTLVRAVRRMLDDFSDADRHRFFVANAVAFYRLDPALADRARGARPE
jgi:hypothetical protein